MILKKAKKGNDDKSALQTNWPILNQLGRSYLDIQKTRVAMELRCQKLEEAHLIDKGLVKEKITVEEDEEGNKVRSRKIVKQKFKSQKKQEEYDNKIKEVLKEYRETNATFNLILSHKSRLHKQEKDLLSESIELFDSSQLWQWCLRTRGLGEVAAMTFVSYINPERAKTVGNMWSYLGLTPNKLRRKGHQTNFNPQIKARFLGVIMSNIIRSNDQYYASLYRVKKDYYSQRPDLVEVNSKKGFKAHIDRMARRVVTKLLVSHAYEILVKDRKLKTDIPSETERHRNSVPIKSEDVETNDMVIARYTKNHTIMLEKLKQLWVEGDKEKYREYLTHADFS